MACLYSLVLLLLASLATSQRTTCPAFPGFCSESYPGQSCQVVCAVGRNNVPLCQDDGTWTDIPRCVEHEPGVEEQIPGLCPGVSGYCSTGHLYERCRFDCVTGPDIDAVCTTDGTWAPYPTCQGDPRELRDGCDGCPGPLGGLRNRTAERILNLGTVSDRRIPKTITNDGSRKTVPSFAGNVNIGPLDPRQMTAPQNTLQQQQNTRQQLQQQLSPQQQRPQPNSLFAEQLVKNTRSRQQTFGVFESVDLGSSLGGPSPPRSAQLRRKQNDGFFGAFENVNL